MKNEEFTFETRLVSSLIKVFPDEELKAQRFTAGTALLNERYSFQVAYRRRGRILKNIEINLESELKDLVTIRKTGLSPAEYMIQHDYDDNVLRTEPGLYPDPLYSLEETAINALPEYWQSLWVTIETNEQVSAGNYPITISFTSEDGDELGKECFHIEVINQKLPDQQLIHTHWLHTDCIATYYQVDPLSEKYWELVEKYIETAVKYGSNMILTPLFTPPLDTAVGHERPTVQLIEVKKDGGNFSFGFDSLKRWISMGNKNGVKYFEFSHLFTQWGAEHAPKVIATENGVLKKVFGWETNASGEEYTSFLRQFFPELIGFIKENNLENRVYFHVSDEPRPHHLEHYKKANNLVREYLSDYPIIDALSDFEFYQKDIVKKPIPSSNHIEPFLEEGIKDLWTYYCVSQYKEVSNRFFVFPSSRNRVLGIQLYKFDITGFLHWGYNFWYSQYSLKQDLDPFKTTDAAQGFPAGDPFAVYPGKEGPIISLRLEVFYEALQDLRALKLLESYIGKEEVVSILEEGLEHPITFKEYPCDDQWLLKKREQINENIKGFVK